MSVKRDRVAIIHDMLQIVSAKGGKVKPTQIMYKANLSHQMLKEYMAEILAKEFLTENRDKKNRRTYALTEKGYKFLQEYQQIRKFFDSYGLN